MHAARRHEHEQDHDERSFGESRGGGGRGYERDDRADHDDEFMPMTRRDNVEDLYRSSLREMKEFLGEREVTDPTRTLPGLALTGGEILAGAAVAGFLAQRFRQAGAVVPVGVTLGLLGIAAAQFNMLGRASPDLRNISLGALASAAALWAAGRGVISREETARPREDQAGQLQAMQPMQPQQPMQQGPGVGASYGLPPMYPTPFTPPQPSFASAAADFQNLVARRPF